MSNNQLIETQRINGGVIASASANTNCWYIREGKNTFSVNGALSSLHTVFDWVLIKEVDNKLFKSGIYNFCEGKTTLKINFKTGFPDNKYFLFFSSNNNVHIYWKEKHPFYFYIIASGPLGTEISWMAIHEKMAYTTGIHKPGSLYAGKRNIIYNNVPSLLSTIPHQSLETLNNSHANLNGWHNNEYIIKPDVALDNIYKPMNLPQGYSVLLSTNKNINIYWIEKAVDRTRIGTSYPMENCTVDYFFVEKGLNWWDEII